MPSILLALLAMVSACLLLCRLSIPVDLGERPLPSSELDAAKLLVEAFPLPMLLGGSSNAWGGGVSEGPVTAVPLMGTAGPRDSELSRNSLLPWLYSEPDRTARRGPGELDGATAAFGGVGGRCAAVGTGDGMGRSVACGVYIVSTTDNWQGRKLFCSRMTYRRRSVDWCWLPVLGFVTSLRPGGCSFSAFIGRDWFFWNNGYSTRYLGCA